MSEEAPTFDASWPDFLRRMAQAPGPHELDNLGALVLLRAADALEETAALKARVEELERVHYLPMDCPSCGRHRLEYSRVDELVKCEKCGVENWEAPEALKP